MALLKKEIRICMGSSCFSRGNKETLQVVQRYLKEHHLEREVVLKGNHCFSMCNEGPIMKVGETIYEKVNTERATEILDKEFNKLKG